MQWPGDNVVLLLFGILAIAVIGMLAALWSVPRHLNKLNQKSSQKDAAEPVKQANTTPADINNVLVAIAQLSRTAEAHASSDAILKVLTRGQNEPGPFNVR
ncbi:gas vesicle protein [Duganella sp. 1224]|uniref:hypothetical protein n=1 Tax=Duganella sp. 1224 TaxID=2587052 RepID=UPI0015CA2B5E|nr:hypothetical protein [Duganella sp. 1224]NYE60836.1 gas vesicle protein [Duganella sp. 1224]